MNKKIIVNIGRQLGSGGREIGEKLAARLGIDFYDKELIQLASEESGLRREFFEKADEKASQNILGGLFGVRFPFIGESTIPATNCLSNDSLFQVQSDVIRRLADEKSCLFVGRCADYILRDHPWCANIFISASKADRIRRLCQLHSISEETAENMMEKADKKRSDYYNYYSNKTWEPQPPTTCASIRRHWASTPLQTSLNLSCAASWHYNRSPHTPLHKKAACRDTQFVSRHAAFK